MAKPSNIAGNKMGNQNRYHDCSDVKNLLGKVRVERRGKGVL